MSQSLRRSGLPLVGDVPPGTHLCHFFQTADDLFEAAQPYFAAGLDSNELCLWLFIDPFGKEVSIEAFRRGLPQFERHLASGAILIEPAEEWLTEHGSFNVPFFNRKWETLLAETRERGFDCLRVGGACFPGLPWEVIRAHEKSLDDSLDARPMIVLCSFSLEATEAAAIIDIAQTHHLAIAQRGGRWDVVETPVRRLRQLEIRSRQQAAVVDLGLHAIRERDLAVVMKKAATIAKEILGTARATVWEARPEHNDILFRSTVGWDEVQPGATFPLETVPVAGLVLASDQPVIVTDTEREKRFQSVLRDYGIASILTAVIRGRERTWGGLSVHSATPRGFDENDLQFMESLANVLALAIERNEHELAERHEKAAAEAALAKLRAIESITDAAVGHMAVDDLLYELMGRLREALKTDGAGVVLLDERNNLAVRASVGSTAPARGVRVSDSAPIWSRLSRDPRPMIIDDYRAAATTPEGRQWVVTHTGSIKSAMAAPLIVEQKMIGFVVAFSNQQRRFTENELDLLRMVADRVAPAIERARLLESVRAGRERLEALSRRLLSVQEEERRRLAIELHDELGQILTAVKINLESMPAQTQHAVDSVDRAMRTTRDLALELRPPMLDDLGLAAALRWYSDRFAQQTSLAVHLAIEEMPDLAPAAATACFRVAQEALTNVARHARARNVWLDVHRTSREVELTVRDDGMGFDVEAARERATRGASLGLVGMEERVSLAGGTIDIHSTPGQGTEVRARFPLKVAHEPDSRVARG